MARDRARLVALLSVALVMLSSASALARVPTCVGVDAAGRDPTALRRLVETELNGHTSDQAVQQDCASHLQVELVVLDSSTGFSAGLRGGRELFRETDVRSLVVVQLLPPTFKSSDADWGVVDQWTPILSLGLGVVL
jgi:chemotaxis response regulator CheB